MDIWTGVTFSLISLQVQGHKWDLNSETHARFHKSAVVRLCSYPVRLIT